MRRFLTPFTLMINQEDNPMPSTLLDQQLLFFKQILSGKHQPVWKNGEKRFSVRSACSSGKLY